MPAMWFVTSVVFEQTRVRWDTEVDAVDVVVMPINQSIHMTFGLTVMDDTRASTTERPGNTSRSSPRTRHPPVVETHL